MAKNSFIQYDQNNSKVFLTLDFDVTEALVAAPFEAPEIDSYSFLETMILALKERMAHCKNILMSDILTADDKVFTEYAIYSNKKHLRFSTIAYDIMQNVVERFKEMKNNDVIPDMRYICRSFKSGAEVIQCIKAVSMFYSILKKEEVIDVLIEVLECNDYRETEKGC